MKIFKNGIEANWVLVAIGYISLVGLSFAATPPIVSDQTSVFGGINATAVNVSGNTNVSGNLNVSGNILGGGINVTQLNSTGAVNGTMFGDIDNSTYYVDPSSTGTSANFAGKINTTGQLTLYSSGVNRGMFLNNGDVVEIRGFNSAGAIVSQLQLDTANTKWYFSGMGSAVTGDALCRISGTAEAGYNSGQTSCAASSESVKNATKTMNTQEKNAKFDKLRPVEFVYKYDTQNRTRVGLIAEEVCPIYPEVCNIAYQGSGTFVKILVDETTGKGTGALYSDGTVAPLVGVSYELYTAILTAKMQEQASELYDKQMQLNILEYRLNKICSNQPSLCN